MHSMPSKCKLKSSFDSCAGHCLHRRYSLSGLRRCNFDWDCELEVGIRNENHYIFFFFNHLLIKTWLFAPVISCLLISWIYCILTETWVENCLLVLYDFLVYWRMKICNLEERKLYRRGRASWVKYFGLCFFLFYVGIHHYTSFS